jgi:phosphoribosylamine---glycine ligase
MKVLVVGSGGREHALCWKISQSVKVHKLYCAPGNGGIADIAECINIKADAINELARFAIDNSVDLTVVGPEAPLAAGIVDVFAKQGLRIFGPDKISAQLEKSKVFAKQMMARFGLPTARFKTFVDADAARDYIDEIPGPFVIKADGLCAGKGVIIAGTKEQAKASVDSMMQKKEFGQAGDRIIIEEHLDGEEASLILVSDGKDYTLFPSSQDYKRIFNKDKGPNTGGMGAYSPATVMTSALTERVEKEIISPIINGLSKAGTPYKGVLYIGLMILDNNPYVLEFNVRLGDPETQAILPRLESDIVDIIDAAIDGTIGNIKPQWSPCPAVCIVCASGGYPGNYQTGFEIHGLTEASKASDIKIFHAGTAKKDGKYFTTGGRVLGVSAISDDIKSAVSSAYKATSSIKFTGIHYRQDIGQKAAEPAGQRGIV